MSLNPTDNFKLRVLLEQSVKSMKFLDLLKVQNDISSELAGFEISKLLKDQQTNELKYSQLVKRRITLVGIVNKRQLEQVELQIASITATLKQSTKKLCKIFKQNPDLQKDSMKAARQRRSLIAKIDQLSSFIQTNTLQKFQLFITQQLQSQDQLRKFMQRQKNLNIQIKRLQQQRSKQLKQYQKQIQQNQNKIQQQKQKLMQQTQTAQIKIGYNQKQHSAQLTNTKRNNTFFEKKLLNDLQSLRVKFNTQTQVHKQLKQYLVKKEDEVKKKSEEWNMKFQTEKQRLDKQIATLSQEKQATLSELSEYKQKYEQEEKRKLEREMAERQKALDKQNQEFKKIQLDNAIRLIQSQFFAWKAAGGGKKKKKKVVKKK